MPQRQNSFLLSQCTGYVIAVILGSCAFLPMLLNVIQSRGKCLLFSGGSFNDTNGGFQPDWSNFSYCGYTLIISAFAILTGLISAYRTASCLYQQQDSSLPNAFWDAVVALIISIGVLIDAIFVSLGFSRWCQTVKQRFSACENAYNMTIVNGDDINLNGFYLEIGCVQFGIWASLVIWTLLLVLAVRKVHFYHERENLIVSMARERRRYAPSTSKRQN